MECYATPGSAIHHELVKITVFVAHAADNFVFVVWLWNYPMKLKTVAPARHKMSAEEATGRDRIVCR